MSFKNEQIDRLKQQLAVHGKPWKRRYSSWSRKLVKRWKYKQERARIRQDPEAFTSYGEYRGWEW
jgi:hypothetical protein